jgi:hypothetical protein
MDVGEGGQGIEDTGGSHPRVPHGTAAVILLLFELVR